MNILTKKIEIDVELMEMYITHFTVSIAMYDRFLRSPYITEEKRREYEIQQQRLTDAFDTLKTKLRDYHAAYKLVKPDTDFPSVLVRTTLGIAGGRKRKKRTRRLRNALRRTARTYAVK